MEKNASPVLDLARNLKLAQEAAKAGREILRSYFGHLSKVSEKNQAGLVSEADVESEKAISNIIKKANPQFVIYGEESSYSNPDQKLAPSDQRPRWIIDPLDGTTNYVHQLPVYCISMGLEVANEIVLALIDVPPL